MKLKFKNQQFQTDAVDSVADLFKGQEKLRSTFEITNIEAIDLINQNELGIGNVISISNDALLANNVPEDVIVQYWTIDYAKQMDPFVQKGGKWIYSDMFEMYLDYPHSMIPLKKVYDFQPAEFTMDLNYYKDMFMHSYRADWDFENIKYTTVTTI